MKWENLSTQSSPLTGIDVLEQTNFAARKSPGGPSFPGTSGKGGVSSEARPSSVSASRYPEASASDLTSAPLKEGLVAQGFSPGSQLGYTSSRSAEKTLTGIDVLEQTHFAALKQIAAHHNNHLKLGLLTNQSGLDRQGRRTMDILLHSIPEVELTTIFSPEHGLYGKQDTEHLQKEQDPTTHLPVISLYGPKSSDKHPKQADLKQLDALVIDLQDAGVRFWTYETLVGYALEACAKAQIEVVLLDRPNPIGGVATQGPVSDVGLESYTDFMPIPLRHGLTLGELARFFNANATEVQLKPELLDAEATVIGSAIGDVKPPATQPGLHAQLTVVAMQNWSRSEFYNETGLPWTPPSPNLRTPAAAILYPGVGLTEQTNVSVGRGTSTPFENLGAPYIDAAALAAYLTQRKIPGVQITPTSLAIAEDANKYPFHGQTIPAIHFEVTDRAAFHSPEFGIEILSALHHLCPQQFQLARARTLIANSATLAALTRGDDPRDIAASWTSALQDFHTQSRPWLLYPATDRR